MSSSSSPCAACKLLRRKCTQGCVFAPYFPPDQPAKFANVHRVFGASNVAKLLNELQPPQREDAVNSLAYEAEARLRDPVYGCVAYISMLQLKIKQVRDDLAAARKELAAYIGPAAFAPFLPHPAAAAAPFLGGPHQYQAAAQYGVGLAPPPPPPHHHGQMLFREQQQQMVDAQHMATAVEQEMLRRAGYGGGGATVAIVPPPQEVPPADSYESSFLVQQHQQQGAAAYHHMEPPPHVEMGTSQSSQTQAQTHPSQHCRAGSDEGSGAVVPPP